MKYMRKIAFVLPFLVFLAGSGQAQVLFHEDFQTMDLDVMSTGSLDAEWTLYNDGNEPIQNPDLTYLDEAWNIWRDEDGSMVAVSLSFFEEAGAEADRWMVSPAVDLSSAVQPRLSFRARALDADNRDGFEVLLSTTGTDKEDFTESLQVTRQARASWAWYTIDLSAYAGQRVHLAFVQNSVDKYILCMDDVSVYDQASDGAVVAALRMPAVQVLTSSSMNVALEGEILNTGSEPIVSYDLCYALEGGDTVRTNVQDVSIAASATAAFSVEASVSGDGNRIFRVWVENINGSGNSCPSTFTYVFTAEHASLPRQPFFLELFSSGMCPNCAPRNESLHPFMLEHQANIEDNSSNFVMVKYQVDIPTAGDPVVNDDTRARGDFYGVRSAPSFFLNGHSYDLVADSIMHARWVDSMAKFEQEAVSLRLRGYLEVEDSTFRISTEITSCLPDIDEYTLQVVLLEDSIHHLTPMYNGEQDFYYCARKMLPAVSGTLIEPVPLGTTVTKEFEYTITPDAGPRIFSSVDNMAAVIFLQNRVTRQVIQAKYLERGVVESSNEESVSLPPRLRLMPNPASDHVLLVFEAPQADVADVQLIDMGGKIVFSRRISLVAGQNREEFNLQGLDAGLYFVRVSSKAGIFVSKMVKK